MKPVYRRIFRICGIVIIFICILGIIIQFITPNKSQTTRPCVVHDPTEEGPLYLVCLGSCSMDTVDAYGQDRLLGLQEEYGYASFGSGHDENSGSSYTIMQMPDDAVTWVNISNGESLITKEDIHPCFCEECTAKIAEILPLVQWHTYVLYDAVAGEYHPISVGTEQIGNYIVETTKEDGGYHMVVTTLA